MEVSISQPLSFGSHRFPTRILASCLRFAQAAEIANASGVCKIWKVSRHLEDILFKPRYLTDFEPETASITAIASGGSDTPWKTRYARRMRVKRNWLTGKFQLWTLPIVATVNTPTLIAGTDLIATYTSQGSSGSLVVVSVSGNPEEVARAPCPDEPRHMAATPTALFVDGDGKEVRQYRLPDLALLHTYKSASWVSALGADAGILAIGGDNGRTSLWNSETKEMLYTVEPVDVPSSVWQIALDVSRDSCWVAYGGYRFEIQRFSLTQGTVRSSKDGNHKFHSMCLGNKGRSLLLTSHNIFPTSSVIYDADTLQPARDLAVIACKGCCSNDFMCFRDNGKVEIRGFGDPSSVATSLTLPHFLDNLQCDTTRLAVRRADGKMSIFDFSPRE